MLFLTSASLAPDAYSQDCPLTLPPLRTCNCTCTVSVHCSVLKTLTATRKHSIQSNQIIQLAASSSRRFRFQPAHVASKPIPFVMPPSFVHLFCCLSSPILHAIACFARLRSPFLFLV